MDLTIGHEVHTGKISFAQRTNEVIEKSQNNAQSTYLKIGTVEESKKTVFKCLLFLTLKLQNHLHFDLHFTVTWFEQNRRGEVFIISDNMCAVLENHLATLHQRTMTSSSRDL